MENLWRWLERANARAVCLCAMLGLIAVAGWWTWREFTAGEKPFRMPPGGQVSEPDDIPRILAYVEEQAGLAKATYSGNPFKRPTGTQTARTAARPPSKPTVRYRVRPQGQSTPKASMVNLTYRGLFKRPDGRTAALIEDRATGRGQFHDEGAKLYGLTIGAIAFDSVVLLLPDGGQVKLEIGLPRTFVEDSRRE
ncbi:MAG: hypothetical protein JXR37_21115 [Kiritimatiellae bacterium]|nr:hypothetical protein [Kiritimatiellia bacterium]